MDLSVLLRHLSTSLGMVDQSLEWLCSFLSDHLNCAVLGYSPSLFGFLPVLKCPKVLSWGRCPFLKSLELYHLLLSNDVQDYIQTDLRLRASTVSQVCLTIIDVLSSWMTSLKNSSNISLFGWESVGNLRISTFRILPCSFLT